MSEVVCGLCDAHVRISCPVRDITHMRKRTLPLYRTVSDGKLGESLGMRLGQGVMQSHLLHRE